MNLHFFIGLAVSTGLIISSLPAEANYKTGRTRSNSYNHQEGFLTKVLAVPVRSAGAIFGVALGMPIRVGKSMAADSQSMPKTVQRDLSGAPPSVAKPLSAAIGVPVGIVTGAVRGSVEGTGHGLESGYKKPFSSQSIGL